MTQATDISTEILFQVINLDDTSERWKKISTTLRKNEMEFERLQAFDGRHRNVKELPRYSHWRSILRYGRPLSGGEVGCYLSHIAAVQRFLASDAKYCVVLEDDAVPVIDFSTKINDLIELLDNNDDLVWTVVNLEKSPRQNSQRQTLKQFSDGFSLVRAWAYPLNTGGLLWNRQGAEQFLNWSRYIWAPIDQVLRFKLTQSCAGLSTQPPVIQQDSVPSELEFGDAHTYLTKLKKSRWYQHRKKSMRRYSLLISRWKRTKNPVTLS